MRSEEFNRVSPKLLKTIRIPIAASMTNRATAIMKFSLILPALHWACKAPTIAKMFPTMNPKQSWASSQRTYGTVSSMPFNTLTQY